MRQVLLAAAAFLFFAGGARADVVMDLEAGNFGPLRSALEKARAGERAEEAAYCEALGDWFRGDWRGAGEKLVRVSSASYPASAWLKNYLSETAPLRGALVARESEHFILWTARADAFLAGYGLAALEKAYAALGAVLGHFPGEKITVEIFPTQESFSAASTLSRETLERSGAIAICKFRRLMALSPEQLAYGYRWLDTLAHEYAHYLVNAVSAGKCPLWLHEGIAKHFETQWRLREPLFLTPGNRTELARALKEGKLIAFARMEPSMVYLENQTEVRLAFSQVAHAVHYIRSLKGDAGIREILKELAAGRSREQAFRSVLGLSDDAFERDWKVFLKAENLQESPGAAADRLRLDGGTDETEEFVAVDLRAHVRLGDRLRKLNKPELALQQYDKALRQEPGNPVALVKAARALLSLGRTEEALERLEKCAAENPNYSPAFALLCRLLLEQKNWTGALEAAGEANAVNPFNPEIHEQWAQAAEALGRAAEAGRERETALALREILR